ncbi:MAG: DUF4352 domain-containing protein [Coriobacteriia bacterium]|nr:DUF4352 domain-containing protein [Coriobacteriia bacterium]MCL2606004.1 DUF4352 domain-containing protein [Coriobacteriia bacterium]
MKKLLYLIVVLALAMALAACAGTDDGPTLVDSNEPAVTEEPVEEEPASIEIFNVGDTVEIGNYRVTINGTRTDTGTDEWNSPDEGNEFFFIDMTFENISDEEQSLWSGVIRVFDADGRQLDESWSADAQGRIDGTLPPGRSLTGEYAVEIPEGATGLELQFEAGEFGGNAVIFSLD